MWGGGRLCDSEKSGHIGGYPGVDDSLIFSLNAFSDKLSLVLTFRERNDFIQFI